jgi:YcaO-like protein with predicted kinase domain
VSLLDGAADTVVSPDHERCVEPSETLKAISPHFRDLGITRLGEITGLDNLGIPIAFAARPNSFTLSISLGKGLDSESAYASAAMEAVEMAVAEQLPAPRFRASLLELEYRGDTVIDLTRVARCQPERLHPSTVIDWVEGYDLVAGKPVLVPWALVGFDHRIQAEGFHDAFEVSSDGLASGNTTAEAVLHGMYELIERDAYALMELLPEDQLCRRLRDSLSIEDLQIERIVTSIERAGMRLQLLDMTTDIAVPAYVALLSPARDDDTLVSVLPSIYGGCGCHSLPGRAIGRALTEAVQARLAFVAGARDDFEAAHYQPREVTSRAMYLRNSGSSEFGRFPVADSHNEAGCATIGERVDALLSKIINAGIDQVVVVELSAASWGISVVRVLIPDLQVPLHGRRIQVSRRALRQLLEATQ